MFNTKNNHLSTELFKLLQQGIEEPEVENRIDYYRPWFKLVNEFIRLESIECKSPTQWALEIQSQKEDDWVITLTYNNTQITKLEEFYEGKYIGNIYIPASQFYAMVGIKSINSMKLITL